MNKAQDILSKAKNLLVLTIFIKKSSGESKQTLNPFTDFFYSLDFLIVYLQYSFS